MTTLLAQESSVKQETFDAGDFIIMVGTFGFAFYLSWIGYKLMTSGNKPEKTGVELGILKLNLETTSGGFCLAFACILVGFLLNKYFN